MGNQGLVLYHGNCPDGFTAAWAVWRALGDSAEYREVNYGAPPPDDVHGRRVILVDFSYPRAVLDMIASRAARVEIYDHHKTAEADLKGWADEAPASRHVVFDMKRSGAGIAWDCFHHGPRPPLVDYVEDRDLWLWQLAQSREVSEYLFSWPRDFQTWNDIAHELEHRLMEAIRQGLALLRAKRARVAKVCENVRWLHFGETLIPVVNAAWDMSELGEYLTERFPGAPCGGYYFDRADQRQWGFRSVGDFDVSALCKQYGGGGHKNAAGFQSAIGWLPGP